MSITENLAPQQSEEWFNARIGKITGSRIASVLDVSPFTSREILMRTMATEISLGVSNPSPGNVATNWGNENEDTAALQASFEESTSFVPGGLFENSDYPGMAYSPDGMNLKKGILLEIKCPYGLRNDPQPEFKSINDMPHYMHQIQLGMHVMDLEVCLFYQWTPNGVRAEYVPRNSKWIEEVAQSVADFFQDLDDRMNDAEWMESLMARHDPEFEMAAQEYKAALHAEKFAKEKVKRAKEQLIALAPEGGFNETLRITKVGGSARVDWKTLAEENVLGLEELDLENYTNITAESFRITLS